jgi:hypothetical protein
MISIPLTISDPRSFPDIAGAPPFAAALYALAQACLAAENGHEADARERDLRRALQAQLVTDSAVLAAAVDESPSVDVARRLWRSLDAAWRSLNQRDGAGLSVTVFAIPVILVVGLERAGGETTLPGVLADPAELATILVEHGAIGGNISFALANPLVALPAIDIAQLTQISSWRSLPALPDEVSGPAVRPLRVLTPAPIAVPAARESVYLRFVVGTALASPAVDLLRDSSVEKWGLSFSRALSRQLTAGHVAVLALPRAPQHLLPALHQGRVAQRAISAQLFVSNAVRRLRASVGEPAAVISAHRAADAVGRGELRLSLSSPFEPRSAEGFRCPLFPLDNASDVAGMLLELLHDCRITDVQTVTGVHADRDPVSGLPLLFKPDTIPQATSVVH